jgi:hypothetical protein
MSGVENFEHAEHEREPDRYDEQPARVGSRAVSAIAESFLLRLS